MVRFGRVTFKVTELVLTKEDIENTKMTLDALKNATQVEQPNDAQMQP